MSPGACVRSDKEHSTIIYESPNGQSLLRLGWNKQDPRYMATLLMDSPKVVILDIRWGQGPGWEGRGGTAGGGVARAGARFRLSTPLHAPGLLASPVTCSARRSVPAPARQGCAQRC